MYICRGIPDHTSENEKTLKKARKIKKRDPKNMSKILSTSNIPKGSQNVWFSKVHTYMIEDAKYFLRLFSKNIFSAALTFYQLHVFMAYKHKNYCAAKQLQKELAAMNDFLYPVSV